MIEESNVKLVTSIPGPKSIEILEERKNMLPMEFQYQQVLL